MAKSKPNIMDLARRAAEVLQELRRLEHDVTAWRLARIIHHRCGAS
jgi:hypothetical protein